MMSMLIDVVLVMIRYYKMDVVWTKCDGSRVIRDDSVIERMELNCIRRH